MIIYKDPDTGYMCKAINAIGITEPYRIVPSHPRDEFNDAITDYDIQGQPVFDLNKAQAVKVNEAKQKSEEALTVITSQYSEAEMKTWPTQEQEARAYVADNTVLTPFLSGLSQGTGIPVLDLANKIILKADAFKTVSAANIGKRQAMEAKALAATDITGLKKVVY